MIQHWLQDFWEIFQSTIWDVAPILSLIVLFQYAILRKPIPNVRRVVIGTIMVIGGLSFFLMGLEKALFPIGEMMAFQLASPEFVSDYVHLGPAGQYLWIYIFAAMIGFATAIAEPSLIIVAQKANEVSAGTLSTIGLRVVVALGVSVSLALGTYRIVTGAPLYMFILSGYVVVIIQTWFAPKDVIALAYDLGGVTTSTVTVPIVTALGIGLASVVPGRNPALDGFGLIAFACLFPIISVLGYVQYRTFLIKRTKSIS